MLKQFLNLKLSQKLSPQQIQLMKLIQLPTQAFEQRLLEEMNENPALETGSDEEEIYEKDEFDNDDANDEFDDYDENESEEHDSEIIIQDIGSELSEESYDYDSDNVEK